MTYLRNRYTNRLLVLSRIWTLRRDGATYFTGWAAGDLGELSADVIWVRPQGYYGISSEEIRTGVPSVSVGESGAAGA